jgi:hypothetical protein
LVSKKGFSKQPHCPTATLHVFKLLQFVLTVQEPSLVGPKTSGEILIGLCESSQIPLLHIEPEFITEQSESESQDIVQRNPVDVGIISKSQ